MTFTNPLSAVYNKVIIYCDFTVTVFSLCPMTEVKLIQLIRYYLVGLG